MLLEPGSADHFLVRSFAIWLICMGVPAYSMQAAGPAGEIAGRVVTLSLVSSDDLSPVTWTGEILRLNVDLAPAQPAPNIFSLLQANGIAPDGEAFALVYDLNPALRQARTIQPGTRPQLPKISSEAALQEMHRRGYLALLTLDPEVRDQLNSSADKLQGTATAFARLPADRFRKKPVTGAREQVESLAKWYGEIKRSFLRRTGPPLRKASLIQLRREVDVLNPLLQRALTGGHDLDGKDVKQIAAIYDDVEVAMANYNQELSNEPPKADALYKVTVGIAGSAANNSARFRVYYTNYGLYRDPPDKECDAFRTPGSGASQLMRAQNYMIWAAQDGDPVHPVTEPLRVKVRPWDNEPIVVTLGLKRNLTQ